ncbi:MAG: MFS transporter [bacterium]|nr:MFS transporter [bacterium]
MWWTHTVTGSTAALGLVAMCASIPRILLAPVTGTLADRWNKRNIIVFTDIIRGTIYLNLARLAFTNSLTLPILLISIVISSISAQFFSPAISASVPLIVADGMLPKANSLQQMSSSFSGIVSYGAGGVLVAWLGVPMLMLLNGISFLLSAFSEMFISIPHVTNQIKLDLKNFTADLKYGFRYLLDNPVLNKILRVALVLNFFGPPVFLLLPKFVNDYIGAGPELYGYLIGAMMTGTLLAAILISTTKIVDKYPSIIMWGITAQGVLMMIFPFLPIKYHYAFLITFLVCGFLNGITHIYFVTMLQRLTVPEHRGKTFGFLSTITGALSPAAQGISGYVATVVALPIIYFTCGLADFIGGIYFTYIPGILELIKPRAVEATPTTAD